ncbi:hypothetical protein G9272_41715 [Streptomyces asoensis]|uniref:Uncharacterized protein n=1 Tax=Streptomyces asoensis TaxID=249586 RepID=A0A6M4X6Y9_9ACTN|nr:hypothetical protein [Streptomyces asoensis]QJT06046.1 hypothetical protein G9272_41715 [Streptomyces asoensis]
MDVSRNSSLSGVGAALRRAGPPPALCGFLLLMALLFAVSYAVGAASGPVAPGMHGTGTGTSGGGGGGGGVEDVDDMGDMGGMADMQGGGH